MSEVQAAPAPAPAPSENPIGDFAKGFLREIEDNPDPDQMDQDEPVETTEGEPQQEETLEAETPPQEEIPVVEYELEDGEKLQVPERLKPHLMRDKDYRQKTMAIAETRKQLEQLTANAEHLAQQAQQMAPYHAQLFAMDNRAQQLQRALQSSELAADPLEYNRAQGELALILRNRDQLANNLGQQENQIRAQQYELKAKKLSIDAPKLFEEVPELAKDDVRKALTEFVANEGLTANEWETVSFSASLTKMAWESKQYRAMVKDQAVSREKLKQQTKSLPSASQSSRAPAKGANTDQLQKEWKKGGGKIHDPAFSALLRAKLR